MKWVARAPGTCGELAQGTHNGVNFLVTCPINLYSVASVELIDRGGGIRVNEGREKSAAAVRKLLGVFGVSDLGVAINIQSEIPTGKGMASSTSDITAACTAVAYALGKPLTSLELARIALSVEPTDGIMFPGIMVFDHVRGIMCRQLRGVPEIDILVVDIGGTIDTHEFNARVNLDLLNKLNEHEVMRALRKIEAGINENNVFLIGKGATLSSYANQRIIEKPFLRELHQICINFGGIGVNTAHSGTVMGLMFARNQQINWTKLVREISDIGLEAIMGPFRMIGGGAEILIEREGQQLWEPYQRPTEEISGQQLKSME